MTELSFTKGARFYESAPIEVSGDFALHLEFDKDDARDNDIRIYRSATGSNHVLCSSVKFSERIYDMTYSGAVEGLSIVVKTLNQPTSGAIL